MPRTAMLYDMVCELEVQVHPRVIAKTSRIHRRIHDVWISYGTRNKILTLRDFKFQDPPSSDRARDKVHLYAEPEVSPYTI